MDDLISRAEVIEAIVSLTAFESEDELKKYVEEKACDDYYLGGLIDAIDEIKDTTAVDAVPVVHARWVDEDFPYKDANANPRVTAICSVCGNVAHRMEHGYSILSKFCPACGARMDGEAEPRRTWKYNEKEEQTLQWADMPTVP